MTNQNKLTQDEIDRLINIAGETEFLNASPVDKFVSDKEILAKYKSVIYARKRLEYSRENQSVEYIKEAKKYFHYAAFSLWLINHKMNKDDYKSFIKREINKRNTMRLNS